MEEGRAATSGVIVTLPGQNPQGATDWLDNNRWAVAEEPFAIRGFRIQPGQAPVIEFHTERGRSYRVQYSDDAKNWKTCPQILSGIDGIRSWSDTGPPRTECPPAEAPARFYRLERLAD